MIHTPMVENKSQEIVDFIMEIMKIVWITSMKYEIFYENIFAVY